MIVNPHYGYCIVTSTQEMSEENVAPVQFVSSDSESVQM